MEMEWRGVGWWLGGVATASAGLDGNLGGAYGGDEVAGYY